MRPGPFGWVDAAFGAAWSRIIGPGRMTMRPYAEKYNTQTIKNTREDAG